MHGHINLTTACVCRQVVASFHKNTSSVEPDGEIHEVSTLQAVANAYMSVHGILSLIVCAFGIPTNVLNIVVLTRKHMRTPVNCILTWLAVFDLLTMTSYVFFSLHFYILTWEISAERNSFGWTTFLIFHIDFTSTTHTISIWLGVTLAMFRYKHIFSPAKGNLTRVRRLVRARISVMIVVVLSVLVMIPNYLMNQLISASHFNLEKNKTEIIYLSEPQSMEAPEVKPLAQINLLLHSVLAKFLPCILIVIYGALLVKTLKTNIRMLSRNSAAITSESSYLQPAKRQSLFAHSDVNRKTLDSHLPVAADAETNGQEQLCGDRDNAELICQNCRSPIQDGTASTMVYLSKSSTTSVAIPKKSYSSSPRESTGRCNVTRHQENSRTTRMLLIVITLYLVTELPQAVLIVLSATIPGFFFDVYLPLGDMMDIVALVNNGINFLLYCVMSRDFRTTLVDMMKSTIDRASEMPGRVSTTLHFPSHTVTNQTRQSQAAVLVRSADQRGT